MERTTIWDLHPVEAMLLLCLLSIKAIGQLISDPPRPFRRRPLVGSCDVTASGSPIYVLPSQSAAAPWGRSVLEPVRETMEQINRDMPAAFAAAAEEIAYFKEAIRQSQAAAGPSSGSAPGVTVDFVAGHQHGRKLHLQRLQQRPPARGFAPDPEQP